MRANWISRLPAVRRAVETGALAAYRQATLIIADYEPAIFSYAVLLARSGRADEAVEYINDRMAAMPKSAAVRKLSGIAKMK